MNTQRRTMLGILTGAAGSALLPRAPIAAADQTKEVVTGIGGVFFRAHDPKCRNDGTQSKWLRIVMGEQPEDPTVAHLKTQEVLPLLVRWHDAIAWQLHDDLERFAPSCIREPGAAGYFEGVKLHSHAWEPLIRNGQRIRKIKVLALSWQKPPANMALLTPAVEGFVPDIAEAYRYMKTRR